MKEGESPEEKGGSFWGSAASGDTSFKGDQRTGKTMIKKSGKKVAEGNSRIRLERLPTIVKTRVTAKRMRVLQIVPKGATRGEGSELLNRRRFFGMVLGDDNP